MVELHVGSAYDIKVRDDRTPAGSIEYVGVIYQGLDASTDDAAGRTEAHLFGFDPGDPYPPFAVPSDSLLSYQPNKGTPTRAADTENRG